MIGLSKTAIEESIRFKKTHT